MTVNALEAKSFDQPDEKRRPPKTQVDVVNLGDTTLGRFTFEPGWRWSETVKTVVNTETCQVNHVGICPGHAYTIPAGHDAWVEGDEAFVGYEVMSAATFAKPA
jgi:hypothetical protein